MSKKIKVLTINWSGSEGSTVKLIRDIEKYTADSFEYYHCYQVGKKSKDNNYLVAPWSVTKFYYAWARVVGLKYGVGILPTVRLVRYIEKVSPDIIHVHCPNFYNIHLYMLFRYLKKRKYPVIVTNHAEFFYTGNCAYAFECQGYIEGCKKCSRVFDSRHKFLLNRTHAEWKKMRQAFSDAPFFRATVVSPWQYGRIKTSPVMKDIPVYVIENAVDINIFRRKPVNQSLIERLHISGKKVILSVTSNFSNDPDDLKGGCYFIEIAKRMPEYIFLVAGNVSLKEGDVLSDNLITLGNVLNQDELADYYNLADLTVLTSRRETYGMACAESMACGTPVVAFKAGGTESIAIPQYSKFVKYGDTNSLIGEIEKWIGKKEIVTTELEVEAKKRYSVERMARQFQKLYNEAISMRNM